MDTSYKNFNEVTDLVHLPFLRTASNPLQRSGDQDLTYSVIFLYHSFKFQLHAVDDWICMDKFASHDG